jgi:hypothetical protein
MTTTHYMRKTVGKALLSGAIALAGLALASGTAHAQRSAPHLVCYDFGSFGYCEWVY